MFYYFLGQPQSELSDPALRVSPQHPSALIASLLRRKVTSLLSRTNIWERLAFVLNRLPHARSRQVVVIALTAERISAALRTAVRTDCSPAIGALRHGKLAAGHAYVAVAGYVLDLAEFGSCDLMDSLLNL